MRITQCLATAKFRPAPLQKKPYEGLDDRIDEQWHMPPMGKSDMNQQSRITFLSKDMMEERRIGVRAVSEVGFRMLDYTFMYGPIALFPRTILSWRVGTPAHITPESLELFLILQPKLDVLILGVGSQKDVDVVRKNVVPTLNKHRIGHEIMNTLDAALTFNALNNEERYVAAGLYPVEEISIGDFAYQKTLEALDALDDNRKGADMPLSLGELMIGLGPGGLQDELLNVCNRIWHNKEQALKAAETVKKIREFRRQQRQIHNEEIRQRQLEQRRMELKQLAAEARERRQLAEDSSIQRLPANEDINENSQFYSTELNKNNNSSQTKPPDKK